MEKEPLVTVASVTSIAAAALGLLVAFGVPLDDTQQKAILAAASVLAPLVVAWLVRPRVTPVPTGADQRGYTLIQLLLAVALFLVIVFLGTLLFDVDFRG